ncbi:MFS transporter [Cohnella candidum]|uniref:MFS transporter n=1 Tax=Cohnella candidum TaxID=2674991 RepID=A0A3G3JUZ7_9BACL|nr:MFS transporter [Cohnella candidum]AYQ72073.1 MFS transporter [Cohnella candidum]
MNKKWINSSFAYGLGMFAMMIPSQAFTSFYSYYYVEKLGLSLGLIALARLIYAIWDAVNNPMMGYFSDRTRTRFGRRRPWIAAAIPLFVLTFVMIFSPPSGLEDQGLFWWLLVGLILFEGVATILWVNYGAIFPEIFRGDRLRAKASAVQQGYQILAILIATVLTPIVYKAIGFSQMSILYGVAFAMFMLLCILGVREDEEASKEQPLPFLKAFKETLSNRDFWVFNFANSFAQTVNGMLSAAIPFYAKYVLHIPESQVSILMASVFVSVIPLVGVWYLIVRKLGGLKGWRLSLLAYGLSVIPLWFGTDLYSGIAAGVLVGFGLSGFLVSPAVLSGQIIDRDAERTGRRREGIYTAVAGFITRSSGLISALAFWFVGQVFGYVSGDEPGPDPKSTFLYLICVIPLILLAISYIISLFVKGYGRPEEPGISTSGKLEA